TNLGVGGSNPSGRASKINKLADFYHAAASGISCKSTARPRVMQRLHCQPGERLMHPLRPRLDIADDNPRRLGEAGSGGRLRRTGRRSDSSAKALQSDKK